jgi:hypothetical protein
MPGVPSSDLARPTPGAQWPAPQVRDAGIMASEALYVPEEYLADVIRVIRAGLKAERRLPREVRQQLKKWCDEEEEYLSR